MRKVSIIYLILWMIGFKLLNFYSYVWIIHLMSPGSILILFQIARKVRIKYDRISYSLQKRETLKTFYERGELIFCVHHCDWWCLFKRTIFFAYINDLRNVKCHFYSHSYLTHFSPDHNTNNQKIILIQQLMQFTQKTVLKYIFTRNCFEPRC